jgi:hypothetical protein
MGVCDRRDGGVVVADPGDGEEGGEESGFFWPATNRLER